MKNGRPGVKVYYEIGLGKEPIAFEIHRPYKSAFNYLFYILYIRDSLRKEPLSTK